MNKSGSASKVKLSSFDDLFGENGSSADQIMDVRLEDLHTFKNHPFRIVDDKKWRKLQRAYRNTVCLSPELSDQELQADISDLNITLIQNYLKEVKSSLYEKAKSGDFIEVCSDMNIISNLPEYVKPKNVGLMFFNMEPDKFFPYTQIDVVQFPSGLGGSREFFQRRKQAK